jgi:glycosyltransferase involved in cell wall biosynthesis
MLLSVPCVAADVGGVTTMMTHGKEGFVYQSTASYMLAHYIKEVFAREDAAAEMGQSAREHALKTHDPETNLRDLLNIYKELAK